MYWITSPQQRKHYRKEEVKIEETFDEETFEIGLKNKNFDAQSKFPDYSKKLWNLETAMFIGGIIHLVCTQNFPKN